MRTTVAEYTGSATNLADRTPAGLLILPDGLAKVVALVTPQSVLGSEGVRSAPMGEHLIVWQGPEPASALRLNLAAMWLWSFVSGIADRVVPALCGPVLLTGHDRGTAAGITKEGSQVISAAFAAADFLQPLPPADY